MVRSPLRRSFLPSLFWSDILPPPVLPPHLTTTRDKSGFQFAEVNLRRARTKQAVLTTKTTTRCMQPNCTGGSVDEQANCTQDTAGSRINKGVKREHFPYESLQKFIFILRHAVRTGRMISEYWGKPFIPQYSALCKGWLVWSRKSCCSN